MSTLSAERFIDGLVAANAPRWRAATEHRFVRELAICPPG